MNKKRLIQVHSALTLFLAVVLMLAMIVSQMDTTDNESDILGVLLLFPMAVLVSALLYGLPIVGGALLLSVMLRSAQWLRTYYVTYGACLAIVIGSVALSFDSPDAGLGVLAAPFVVVPAVVISLIVAKLRAT